jgi:hypothetical protein
MNLQAVRVLILQHRSQPFAQRISSENPHSVWVIFHKNSLPKLGPRSQMLLNTLEIKEIQPIFCIGMFFDV